MVSHHVLSPPQGRWCDSAQPCDQARSEEQSDVKVASTENLSRSSNLESRRAQVCTGSVRLNGRFHPIGPSPGFVRQVETPTRAQHRQENPLLGGARFVRFEERHRHPSIVRSSIQVRGRGCNPATSIQLGGLGEVRPSRMGPPPIKRAVDGQPQQSREQAELQQQLRVLGSGDQPIAWPMKSGLRPSSRVFGSPSPTQ